MEGKLISLFLLLLTIVLSASASLDDPCDAHGPGGWDGEDCKGYTHGDLFPDPFDCGRFYQCVWGVAKSMTCESGLHFSDTKKVCDFPEDANCEEKCHPTTTTMSPTTTTTATTTTASTTTTTTSRPIPCDVHQFHIGFTRVDWRTAVAECSRSGGKVIASINSQSKYECVLRVIATFGGNHKPEVNWWIGGNDWAQQGEFVWSATGAPVQTFFPVGNPQPDNAGGNERCVSLRKVFPGSHEEDAHVMNDDDCDLKFDYICEYRGNP